jgi:hypothetical protein
VVAVLPGSPEVVGIIDPVALVELDDAQDAVFVPVRLGDNVGRGEYEAVRLEDDVVGDPRSAVRWLRS